MGKIWFLCEDCSAKAEKLDRALNDDEMCEDCFESVDDSHAKYCDCGKLLQDDEEGFCKECL